MTIKKIWFDNDYIYGEDENGKTLKQSLIWYPRLKEASDEERQNYRVGYDGFHWRALDEDVSFESFEYDDAEPTPLQKFFLAHKELNVAEFAKHIGINASRLEIISMVSKSHQKRESRKYYSISMLLGLR